MNTEDNALYVQFSSSLKDSSDIPANIKSTKKWGFMHNERLWVMKKLEPPEMDTKSIVNHRKHVPNTDLYILTPDAKLDIAIKE